MNPCPVCGCEMRVAEVRADQAAALVQCPQCQYIKTAELLLSNNSPTGRRACIFGITGYGKRQ